MDENNMRKEELSDEGERNKMGVIACMCYVLGNIIGSGIFTSPSAILAKVNSTGLSLIIWIVCGLYSLFGLYLISFFDTPYNFLLYYHSFKSHIV